MTSAMELQTLIPSVPSDITDAMEREYVDLESRFARGDWGPAELDGGRFAEAVLRYLEWKRSGHFTPIADQLDRTTIVNSITNDASLPEGLRFHVRRCAELLLDVRNKRYVAHLGNDVDVNEMDAHLVFRLTSWSLSEIIREESNSGADEVQKMVDRLSVKHLPLVEEVAGELIVVATNLTALDRSMLALYRTFPEALDFGKLRTAVKYENPTRFRGLIKRLAKEALVHVKGDDVYLTRKGVRWVEQNIDFSLRID